MRLHQKWFLVPGDNDQPVLLPALPAESSCLQQTGKYETNTQTENQINKQTISACHPFSLAAAVHAVEQVANGGDKARAEECGTKAEVSWLWGEELILSPSRSIMPSVTLILVFGPGVAVRREHLSSSAAGLQRRGGGAGHKGKSTQGSQALTTCKPRIWSTNMIWTNNKHTIVNKALFVCREASLLGWGLVQRLKANQRQEQQFRQKESKRFLRKTDKKTNTS